MTYAERIRIARFTFSLNTKSAIKYDTKKGVRLQFYRGSEKTERSTKKVSQEIWGTIEHGHLFQENKRYLGINLKEDGLSLLLKGRLTIKTF